MRRLLRRGFTLLRGQKGVSLIEVLVAVGILAVIGGGLSYALYSGYRGNSTVTGYATAERLARTQLEAVKAAPYDDTLPLEYPIIDLPNNYSISLDVAKKDGDGDGGTIQTITVTVTFGAEAVLTLQTFKTKGIE